MPQVIFDPISYSIGKRKGNQEGYQEGYQQGIQEATGLIEITSGITCTDDGEGNITITEDE